MDSGNSSSTKHNRRRSIVDKVTSEYHIFSSHDSGQIKSAVIHTTVNILGIVILSLLYFNYLLLKPYLYIFLWALAISIPLHSLKSFMVSILRRKNILAAYENPTLFAISVEFTKLFLNVNYMS